MKLLHLDCFSGASGDMLLAALLDAGAREEAVRGALDRLDLAGWELDVSDVSRGGMRARRAKVSVTEDVTSRTYRDVVSILERASLPGKVRSRALETFHVLAEAEARIHGAPIEEVHFHEVGAVDALVDVVGVSAAIHDLAPERITAGPLPTGGGTAATAHGTLPVPAPAVLEILSGAPIVGRGEHELVTPTGAALLRALCDRFGAFPNMVVERTGYGAGARDIPGAPNVLRAVVGTAVETSEEVLTFEVNLDDVNPELIPHVIDRTLAAGALDAWATPVLMKKGRPGYVLSVLGSETARDAVVDILFRESSTLGVRIRRADRHVLAREIVTADVDGQPVEVKIGRLRGEVVNVAPEHDSARAAAETLGLPLKEVYQRATAAARDHLSL
jgi:pyridinium-3,5-bisthiocarboxylic acid mononucleotide nickel chelatase